MPNSLARAAITAIASALLLCSCTYPITRYSPSSENLVKLRALRQRYPQARLRVSDFASPSKTAEIDCRLGGSLELPDRMTVGQYIGRAMASEVALADLGSEGGRRVEGSLEKLDLHSFSGEFEISAHVTVGGQVSYSTGVLTKSYESSVVGENACRNAAMAFVPATQDLISKIISSPEFERALAESNASATPGS